jgi:type I restriction enzyme M protein
MIFKTNIFNKIINESTRGSVRQILAFDILDSLKIPLPPLEIQKKLVQTYQDRLNFAVLQEQYVKDKEQEIEDYLYKELGIKLIEDNNTKNIMNFVRFKDFIHWGVSKQNNIKFTSKYDLIKLEHCCYNFKNGVNFNKSQFGKGDKFINIKDVYADKYVNLKSLDRIKIDTNKLESNLIKNNDLVFVRSSVKYEGVGFPSLIKLEKDEKITFCGFVIKCSININIINPDFLLFVLRSSIFRNITIERSNKSTITNIAQPALKSLNIPLPSLNIQEKISNHIQILKDERNNLENESINNKNLALKEFEKEIFNEA